MEIDFAAFFVRYCFLNERGVKRGFVLSKANVGGKGFNIFVFRFLQVDELKLIMYLYHQSWLRVSILNTAILNTSVHVNWGHEQQQIDTLCLIR
jgi:hypothetical protein